MTTLERRRGALICSAALALTVGPAVEGGAQCTAQLRVMTFNILRQGYWERQYQGDTCQQLVDDRDTRCSGTFEPACSDDGSSLWDNDVFPRRDRVLAIISANHPDILGVQEANRLQWGELQDALPGYGSYAVGDEGDKDDGGSHNAIFYATPRFERVGQGTFWYSDTPDDPGTNYTDCTNGAPAWPRMASWIQLRDNAADLTYLVLNTHWDGRCNTLEARLVRQMTTALGGGDPPAIPTIITGDLNSHPDAPAIRLLTNRENDFPGDFRLSDSHVEVHGDPGSFGNCFTGCTNGRVDYVLHSGHFAALDSWTDDSTLDGYCVSDHWAEVAELQIDLDREGPELRIPEDVTIECDGSTDPASTGEAAALDACDPEPQVAYSDAVAPGECPQQNTIIRTWTTTDAHENRTSENQIITVVDETAPILECNAPPTISPNDAPIAFTGTANDNCDEEVSVEVVTYDCFKLNRRGKRIDKRSSCVIELTGGTARVLDTGGVGTHIHWRSRATDDCGRTTETECRLEVVKPAPVRSHRRTRRRPAGGTRAK